MGEEIRTLLIRKKNGEEIQIDIPVSWKVTFGPAAVGFSRPSPSDGKIPMALRIYESDKMQRAIFTEVESFRDMSIPIRVKNMNIQSKDGVIEVDGSRKRTSFRATTIEWVNPDESVEGNLLRMPSDQEIYNSMVE